MIEGKNERNNQNDALIYILILIHLHLHTVTHDLICIRLILNVQLTCSVDHHELEEQLSQKCVIKYLSLTSDLWSFLRRKPMNICSSFHSILTSNREMFLLDFQQTFVKDKCHLWHMCTGWTTSEEKTNSFLLASL